HGGVCQVGCLIVGTHDAGRALQRRVHVAGAVVTVSLRALVEGLGQLCHHGFAVEAGQGAVVPHGFEVFQGVLCLPGPASHHGHATGSTVEGLKGHSVAHTRGGGESGRVEAGHTT